MVSDLIVFLGVEFAVRNGWKNFVAPPSAPSNYKDPDKITAYVKDAWARLEDNAKRLSLTGYVSAAFLLTEDGSPATADNAPTRVYRWLTEKIQEAIKTNTTVHVVGFEPRQAVRMMAMSAAMQGDSAWGLRSLSDRADREYGIGIVDLSARLGLGHGDDDILALMRFVQGCASNVTMPVVEPEFITSGLHRAQYAKVVFDAFNLKTICD